MTNAGLPLIQLGVLFHSTILTRARLSVALTHSHKLKTITYNTRSSLHPREGATKQSGNDREQLSLI